MPQAGSMAHDDKNPAFSERVREQLLVQRILVLDGVLDDDNGTLLAAQLLRLAAEDPAADVALWINSPGGSVPSMLATNLCSDRVGVPRGLRRAIGRR